MKFKNVSPLGDLEVPVLRAFVAAGETVEVPDELAEGFALQPITWEPVGRAAKELVKSEPADAVEEPIEGND